LSRVSFYVKIFGLVHGVRFRASMAELAFKLEVSGWVKNVPDGTVEALLEGDDRNVSTLIDWANRGPSGARVDSVKVERQPVRNLRGFRME
jgi:acylphosphatase